MQVSLKDKIYLALTAIAVTIGIVALIVFMLHVERVQCTRMLSAARTSLDSTNVFIKNSNCARYTHAG